MEEMTPTAADIFNAAVAAPAIGAAWETGALDDLRELRRLDAEEFAHAHELEPGATLAMFRALASVGVVERHSSTIRPGPSFDEVYRTRSFFHWLTQGSGELFRRMPAVLREKNRVGQFYERDAVAISYACRDINAAYFDPAFWRAMDGLDTTFTTVADLGCGSGERLMQIVDRHRDVRAVGIDIASATLDYAAERFAAAGLPHRATFVEADVRIIEPRPEYRAVELLTCFMMGHDFWPETNCIASLQGLRRAFPNVRKFLLGDTARTDGIADADLPVFTLGFEVGHALMGVYLPTLREWDAVFERAGWHRVRTYDVEMPADSVIFELEPA
jgi:SAM-dependent methyltransferase